MESLIDQDDWMFPWAEMDMGSQQLLTSGLPDLSSACFESPWLEGIDGLQSTLLLSNCADHKGDFSLFDTFHQSVMLPEVLFTDTENNSYAGMPPSMSPESQSSTPIDIYEGGFQYTDYPSSSSSPGYTSPPPLYNILSPGYSSPLNKIQHSPSLDFAPQSSIPDLSIKSPMALNFEDCNILEALADENYTLIAPESELLPVCDPLSEDKRRFSLRVFDLCRESSLSTFVQEVPQDPEEFDEAQLEESDPVEEEETVWMRNILEELMVAPELLSPVSSDDVDSILSGDSLNTAHQALQTMLSMKTGMLQESELAVSSPVLSVPSDFVSILDMNPSSCDSTATSSFDGYGESVLYVSANRKYTALETGSSGLFHSEGPYGRPDRRLKKKEQNKTAALRYRHKKREQKGVVLTEVEQLELRNEELKNRAADLTREINYLKGLMDEICKT